MPVENDQQGYEMTVFFSNDLSECNKLENATAVAALEEKGYTYDQILTETPMKKEDIKFWRTYGNNDGIETRLYMVRENIAERLETCKGGYPERLLNMDGEENEKAH